MGDKRQRDRNIAMNRDRKVNDQGEPFGTWLLAIAGEENAVGELAKVAKTDRQFKAASTPEELRKLMRGAMADGDLFAVVDDAEGSWLAA
jgi:hypothetical protein